MQSNSVERLSERVLAEAVDLQQMLHSERLINRLAPHTGYSISAYSNGVADGIERLLRETEGAPTTLKETAEICARLRDGSEMPTESRQMIEDFLHALVVRISHRVYASLGAEEQAGILAESFEYSDPVEYLIAHISVHVGLHH